MVHKPLLNFFSFYKLCFLQWFLNRHHKLCAIRGGCSSGLPKPQRNDLPTLSILMLNEPPRLAFSNDSLKNRAPLTLFLVVMGRHPVTRSCCHCCDPRAGIAYCGGSPHLLLLQSSWQCFHFFCHARKEKMERDKRYVA